MFYLLGALDLVLILLDNPPDGSVSGAVGCI